MYAMYEPFQVFFYVRLTLSVIGTLPIIRFLYFYFSRDGSGHILSLILGGVLLVIGFVTFLFGLFADLISFDRQLTAITLAKIEALELQQRSDVELSDSVSREETH